MAMIDHLAGFPDATIPRAYGGKGGGGGTKRKMQEMTTKMENSRITEVV